MKETLTNQNTAGYSNSFINNNNNNTNNNNNNNNNTASNSITNDNSRKYAMLSTEWISAIGEELGMHPLPDPLLKRLAEDASYRLREILYVSIIDLFFNKCAIV